jgi:hypothetical protein
MIKAGVGCDCAATPNENTAIAKADRTARVTKWFLNVTIDSPWSDRGQ